MKKFFTTALLLAISVLYAQVGINTDDPTRTLHVNGNLKIRQLEDKSKDFSYNKILATDSEGNVDYVTHESLLPVPDEFTSNKEVYNSIYGSRNGGADNSKFVSCGKFDFRFNTSSGTTSDVQLRLKETPTVDKKMFISIEQSWDNGMEFIAYTTPMTFPANKNNFINIPYGPGIVDFELNVLYLLYPGETDLFRVTAYRVKQPTMGNNYRDYTIACEKI